MPTLRNRQSPKATKKLRARIQEITSKRQSGRDVKHLIAELTPVLRGWGNYFRTGNVDREFHQMGFLRSIQKQEKSDYLASDILGNTLKTIFERVIRLSSM